MDEKLVKQLYAQYIVCTDAELRKMYHDPNVHHNQKLIAKYILLNRTSDQEVHREIKQIQQKPEKRRIETATIIKNIAFVFCLLILLASTLFLNSDKKKLNEQVKLLTQQNEQFKNDNTLLESNNSWLHNVLDRSRSQAIEYRNLASSYESQIKEIKSYEKEYKDLKELYDKNVKDYNTLLDNYNNLLAKNESLQSQIDSYSSTSYANNSYETNNYYDSDGGGSSSDIVYITETGEKYHASNCRYLRRSCIQTTRGSAEARGYDPCSVCDP